MAIQITQPSRSGRLKIAMVAAALALAVLVLAIQLSSVWTSGSRTSVRAPGVVARPESVPTSALAELSPPGAHRGQVRFGQLHHHLSSSPHPRGPHRRPKWGSVAGI
jgi:hypothetical protein